MDVVKTTVNGLSSTVCFAGVVARVESLCGRMGESTRHPATNRRGRCRGVV